MLISEEVLKKWKPIIEHESCEKIHDRYRREVTIKLMENTQKELGSSGQLGTVNEDQLTEAPTNVTGANIANWDPILIPLIRRTTPKLIAFDTVGVQPMSGPTGLIFIMKTRYTNQTGTEAFFTEPDTAQSGEGTSPASPVAQSAIDTVNNPFEGIFTTNSGMSTAESEALGDGAGNPGQFQEMSFSIEKASVTAKTRALKAEYSTELAQDLKAIHNLDAESELANILAVEITAEINREIVRAIYTQAKLGAQRNTATPGTFDMDVDSNGRWSVEKFKGLMINVEREANRIAKETRRGRGNWIICSSDVATALSMAGKLEINPLRNKLNVDDTGDTFVGILNGKYRVFIDPYWDVSDMEICVVGYKGANAWDAGIFYSPYVPLQMVRAIGEKTFEPKIGFKTRYGLTSNPFVVPTPGADVTAAADTNTYFRKFAITNIM